MRVVQSIPLAGSLLLVCCACSSIGLIPCTPSIEPGLVVWVTNAQTGEGITNAVLTLTEGAYTETLRAPGSSTGSYTGADERPGTYTLTVEAPGFVTQTVDNIVVESDICHVKTVSREVALTPAG